MLSRRRQLAIYPGCCWPTSHLSCSSLLRRRPSVNWLASPRSPLIAQVQPLQSQEVHLKALWSDHPRDNDRPVRRVSLECARGRGIWEKRNRKISSSKKVFSFQNRQKENAPPKKGSFAQIYQKKNRKCLKSSTWPDSRHQNWPSMGMFLLRKNISHLCDFLQESLRGLFQCSAHRLQ